MEWESMKKKDGLIIFTTIECFVCTWICNSYRLRGRYQAIRYSEAIWTNWNPHRQRICRGTEIDKLLLFNYYYSSLLLLTACSSSAFDFTWNKMIFQHLIAVWLSGQHDKRRIYPIACQRMPEVCLYRWRHQPRNNIGEPPRPIDDIPGWWWRNKIQFVFKIPNLIYTADQIK